MQKNISKFNLIFFLFFFLFPSTIFSQVAEIDSIVESKDVRIKKGFSGFIFPVLSFDSDLGFQYGVMGNLFHFGDGSRYPMYNHALYAEYSRYTKGSQQFRVNYESDRLIKNVQTGIDIAYLDEMMAYFYGYNGYNAVYDKAIEKENRAFYRYSSQSFRLKADFIGRFGKTHWGWIAGVNFMHYDVGLVDYERINSDKTNTVDNLPSDPNMYLYTKYVNWGIISEEETESNWLNYIKIGGKYDTRDHTRNPFSGILSEVMIQGAPGFLFNPFPHAKLAVIHRQYIPIIRKHKRMLFAYRLFYQTTIGNSKVPFYAQPLLMSSFETSSSTQGLGGGRSLRGILRNRVVGDGFIMANAEFRLKLFQFTFLKQYFDAYTNPFIDAGYITKKIDISEQLNRLPEEDRDTYFRDYKQQIHTSGGLGFKLIINDNLVFSLDMGGAFDKRDGDGLRMYFNLNYSF